MKDKELKRLSRAELLELLLEQTRQRELLEQRLEEAEKKLADRQLRLEKAGDIAHAVLEVNGVMEAAQAAARQYIENISISIFKAALIRWTRRIDDSCRNFLTEVATRNMPAVV